jgi:hypothetical protein
MGLITYGTAGESIKPFPTLIFPTILGPQHTESATAEL